MNLYILRHGIAVEPGTPGFENDSDRPLIPKGERRLRAAAAAMEKMELSFDLILSSPFVRAQQTAEIVAGELKLKKRLEFSDALVPGGNPKALIQAIERIETRAGKRFARRPRTVFEPAHQPARVRRRGRAAIEMKKGGLCKLEVGELQHGQCARLAWLLTPTQMELMA